MLQYRLGAILATPGLVSVGHLPSRGAPFVRGGLLDFRLLPRELPYRDWFHPCGVRFVEIEPRQLAFGDAVLTRQRCYGLNATPIAMA